METAKPELNDLSNNPSWKRITRFVLTLIILIIYVFYVRFVIANDRGPVDYEIFMEIGGRFLNHQPVYVENSYYPLPYVMVFAFFVWLPRPLGILVWFLAPIVAVLIIARWKPGLLLFAPVISHFLGGQTALPAMLGLWGYRSRRQPDDLWGGVWLAVITFKPQLVIFPAAWAAWQWLQYFRSNKRVPLQAWGFLCTSALIYLPSFILQPGWVGEWMSTPRPLFERALAGFIPRSLMYIISPSNMLYWIVLLLLSVGMFILIWWKNGRKFTFDLFMASSFIINPLAHDYDLIQLVPLLDSKKMLQTALLISIPAWLVILFAYQEDKAWFLFTLIPPVIAWKMLKQRAQGQDFDPQSRRTATDEASEVQ